MTARARDLLVGVLPALVTLVGVVWQVDQAGAFDDARAGTAVIDHQRLPRLICPLH